MKKIFLTVLVIILGINLNINASFIEYTTLYNTTEENNPSISKGEIVTPLKQIGDIISFEANTVDDKIIKVLIKGDLFLSENITDDLISLENAFEEDNEKYIEGLDLIYNAKIKKIYNGYNVSIYKNETKLVFSKNILKAFDINEKGYFTYNKYISHSFYSDGKIAKTEYPLGKDDDGIYLKYVAGQGYIIFEDSNQIVVVEEIKFIKILADFDLTLGNVLESISDNTTMKFENDNLYIYMTINGRKEKIKIKKDSDILHFKAKGSSFLGSTKYNVLSFINISSEFSRYKIPMEVTNNSNYSAEGVIRDNCKGITVIIKDSEGRTLKKENLLTPKIEKKKLIVKHIDLINNKIQKDELNLTNLSEFKDVSLQGATYTFDEIENIDNNPNILALKFEINKEILKMSVPAGTVINNSKAKYILNTHEIKKLLNIDNSRIKLIDKNVGNGKLLLTYEYVDYDDNLDVKNVKIVVDAFNLNNKRYDLEEGSDIEGTYVKKYSDKSIYFYVYYDDKKIKLEFDALGFIDDKNESFIQKNIGEDRNTLNVSVKSEYLKNESEDLSLIIGENITSFSEKYTITKKEEGNLAVIDIFLEGNDNEESYNYTHNQSNTLVSGYMEDIKKMPNPSYLQFWVDRKYITEGSVYDELSRINKTKVNNLALRIYDIGRFFAKYLIFFSVIGVGIQIIIMKKAPLERAKSLYSLIYISVGTLIISSTLLLAPIITNIAFRTSSRMADLYTTIAVDDGYKIPQKRESREDEYLINKDGEKVKIDLLTARNTKVEENETEFKIISTTKSLGKLVNNILRIFFEYVLKGFQYIRDIIFGQDASIERVVFLKTAPGKIVGPYEPFTIEEYSLIKMLYTSMVFLVTPLIFIIVIKTGLEYIIYSSSFKQREELKGDFKRWGLSILFILVFPTIFELLLDLFNGMVKLLPPAEMRTSIKSMILSGEATSVAGVADEFVNIILKGSMFLYIEFQIFKIFLIRKIVLTTMFVIAPLISVVWGMRTGANTVKVWVGDLMSNMATQFFYGFAIYIMLYITSAYENNWLFEFMWLMMAVKMAETFKHTLVPYLTDMQNIQEDKQAAKLTGGLKGTIGLTKRTFGLAKNGAKTSVNSFKGITNKFSKNDLTSDKSGFDKFRANASDVMKSENKNEIIKNLEKHVKK